ncbi:hypothetical protein [Shewanella sp. LZH-2]|uniref:hypothetical protein n=1 Tax=Shewanella sp. LZH-2 TaxID=2806008 RepID=UPI00193EB5B4|nr:hypothetical protein [Shewanella sp. LZH-2]QRK80177.1 hypothetical protein JM642_03430 [Shewanella sp. LZH-2]
MTTNPLKQLQAEQAQTPRTEKSFKWLIVFLAIVAVCLVAFYFLNFHGGIGDKGDFGAFGDYFGGVLNPILGFATVSLLVWSLKYQMDELALTRQVLEETQKEAALSRQAMEAQVTHLKQDAKLTELQGVLKAQLDIINDLLTTHVHTPVFGDSSQGITFDNILNSHTNVKLDMGYVNEYFRSDNPNPIKIVGKALEIQLIQLGHLSIAYLKESSSMLYALPYLANATTLLSKFYNFQPNESIKTLLLEIDAQIRERDASSH